MEDELLQELDSILKPAITRSWNMAKRTCHGTDPREGFLQLLKVQMVHTRVDLSKTMYKMDHAMKGRTTDVERAAWEFVDPFPQGAQELPDVGADDYVREALGGYQVWNGTRWVQLSKEADIKVEVFQDPENGNRPAVRVWAKDAKTKTSVLFIDNDLTLPGWDYAHTQVGGFEEEDDFTATQRSRYWEDPFYRIAKNVTAIGGMTAGAWELRHVGNLTPWRTGGDAFRNAKGWYRNKEGLYEQLGKQRARGAGGYQKSAKGALKRAKVFKRAGRIFFWVGVLHSGYEVSSAYKYNDSNRGEVASKATVDVIIGVIGAFGGPVGWVVAGTYFILDVSGAFGDWGRPSGISEWQHGRNLSRDIRRNYGQRIKQLEFEMDYMVPIEQQHREIMEERTIERDNTRVAMPKILFKN